MTIFLMFSFGYLTIYFGHIFLCCFLAKIFVDNDYDWSLCCSFFIDVLVCWIFNSMENIKHEHFIVYCTSNFRQMFVAKFIHLPFNLFKNATNYYIMRKLMHLMYFWIVYWINLLKAIYSTNKTINFTQHGQTHRSRPRNIASAKCRVFRNNFIKIVIKRYNDFYFLFVI